MTMVDDLSERLRVAEAVRDDARAASARDLDAARRARLDLAEAKAEVARMRPVYDAALGWREGVIGRHYPLRDLALARVIDNELGRALKRG